ncbi:hypothetical protein DQ238_08790 [Geodermatophilus sp. TF02-6]|uniref:anthrone oxygenase family protein n=1 Tax=Geodermatophilus sp. TF02-6 TaxID=2250575 RepID=UPI000DE80606|nr:anthrone oxygenase family protein [Geodermatophilus sp. TF02-6]RBY80649.1 hypothetical protein DQ238_08790 [Geodermatophilus sp. TF02-6]
MRKSVQLAGLVTTGLLAGNEVGTLMASHPALRSLPLSAEIEAERALTTRLGTIMPFYMVGTVVATTAAAVDRRGAPGSRLAVAAAACTAVMLGITVVGQLPLNARTVAYPPDGDAAGWAEIRRSWERRHVARVLLDLAAFGTSAVATMHQRTHDRGERR